MSSQTDSIMLDVENLSKSFGSFQALKGLTFQVRRGDVFGFLGPNGAGKTTTMRIVTCFMPASSGTIKVAGVDTRENDLLVRRRIGYLPESNPLYPDMQVEEYLAFTAQIRGMSSDAQKRRIDQMCEICNISSMRRRLIGNLSKGYRQRVGLAQALMHDPDLLILDEPTSGLDPNQIIEIRQLIKRIGSEKTVIYCSHILSEVAATCNRIMIINNGRIVAAGTPDELTSQGGEGVRYVARLKGDKDEIRKGLCTVSGVNSARARSSADGWHEFEILASGGELGEAIFNCVAGNHWSLSELKRESASLEDVFIQLTRG